MYDATYKEKVNRFVVEYHEELPAKHKAEMRLNGIDPDERWCLMWSFEKEEGAIRQKEADEAWYSEFCQKHGYRPFKTFRVRDLGETMYIQRSVMF